MTNDWLQVEFEEALEALSPGPTLTLDDIGMLDWLMTTVEVLDPKGDNNAFSAAFRAGVLFTGTIDQVEYFIRAVLDNRVHPIDGPPI